jgi:hypothetical protein
MMRSGLRSDRTSGIYVSLSHEVSSRSNELKPLFPGGGSGMGKDSDGFDRREFFGLTSAAAVAAAGGLSTAAEAALEGPGPAKS